MEELFVETKQGRIPIDPATADRYDLNKGTQAPFTNSRIVGREGDFNLDVPLREESIKEDFLCMPFKGLESDGIDQMENGFELSQSEIIDFSQGTDSGD